MIAGVHYEDEQLLDLLATDSQSDPHLSSCSGCRERLASFCTVDAALRDRSTWDDRPLDETPVPATIANLRAFADRMTAEDTQADLVLRQILAGPRETWTAALDHRTAGMVRKLIEASERAIDTMPPDAVHLATLATDLAAALPNDAYPSDTVPRLRGAAWRERAYALFYTGAFADAERAIFASESHFSDCLVDEYDRGRLELVRAMVYRAFDRVDEAVHIARREKKTFARFGDVKRTGVALSTEAYLLMKAQNFAGALNILDEMLRQANPGDDDEQARLHTNIAVCHLHMGDFAHAMRSYDIALHILEDLGYGARAARVRWNIAVLLFSAGRLDEAHSRLLACRDELRTFGNMSEVAVANLYIAEILLIQERFDDADVLCRESIAFFERAGLAYSSRALTALTFIREAAEKRRATAKQARHVREYILQLPNEPQLLFARPPE